MGCLWRRFFVVTMVVAVAVCAVEPGGAQWRSLFDGETLEGWHVRGGFAEYRVEDGAIVGTTVEGSPNTFLCTENDYGDFVLEFEVKCDAALNSGVQIRSHATGDGHVYGYQVEIAPGSSGGIWDEARRRRWVYRVERDSEAAKAYKENEWNRFRVECMADHIGTWINGVACTDVVDAMDMTGFIGLQVHSVRGNPKLTVRWRNIRIQEIGRHVWRPLFDGKTLEGWHALPGGKWEVKDGVGVHGFQAEVAAADDIGGLYETGGRAWVIKPTAEDVKKWFKPGEWNEMTVSARGRRVVVHVNDHKTAELIDDPGRLKGRFGLQLHGGQDMEVMFKDVEILMAQKAVVRMPFDGKDLSNWQVRPGKEVSKSKWAVGVAAISPENPKMLVSKRGRGEMINLAERHGHSFDLFSKDTFGDARIEVEVMVPQGSNSGIYVMGEYEIQVLDSFGREKMGSGDMGAVYGASPPPVNPGKKPGEWQKYVIDVNAPRFDSAGSKTANTELVKVQLNGIVLHENLVLPRPTPGGVSGREAAAGPIMFQGNHGAVAYRNIRVTEFVDAE